MALKLLHRVRAVFARLKYLRTLSLTLAAFTSLRLFSDVVPRPLPATATGDSPHASTSAAPQSSGKFERNAKSSSIRPSLKDPELAKFSAIADTWWDSDVPRDLLSFAPLFVDISGRIHPP